MFLELEKKNSELVAEGLLLPLMEDFYSIQGEGAYVGRAAYFIRVGGCDIGCKWCDEKASWNANFHPLTKVETIIDRVLEHPANCIVVTGGEPSRYNLEPLTSLAKSKNIKTFIETSGVELLTGEWDWVCLSPKKNIPPVEENFAFADELKIIIEDENDFNWAIENSNKVSSDCKLYLQPEWSKSEELIPIIVDFVKENISWAISLQAHKYLHIP